MSLLHLYRHPGLTEAQTSTLLARAQQRASSAIRAITTEFCFNIDAGGPLTDRERRSLGWLLGETFQPDGLGEHTFLGGGQMVFEVGPRMNFTTAWSTNAVAICRACGIATIRRIERSRRYAIDAERSLSEEEQARFLALVHDRMTECPYPTRLETFATGVEPEPVFTVPVLRDGRAALERINREMGLAFDEWDLDYYTTLFAERIGRDPTNVECFDIAQSNSEHSRHWFFKGRLVIDGQPVPLHLIALIKDTLDQHPNNSVIAFRDNSSAIRGYRIDTIVPAQPGQPSPVMPASVQYDVIFTAETHNFPSGVAPFPGAETGTGGRIRDVHATGRGALVLAGTAAYCVGNLRIPGYEQPWEDAAFRYPPNLASPLEIEIEASNGASDYGNKFGEPVIQGYTRALGLRLPNGERREWLKPIMFSGGIGQMDARHADKGEPETGMELDFNAVQRGDAEMEQKVNRVIRACVELGERNPIVSIHDQGAGGNCNVLKEIVHPGGARIEARAILVGDDTLSVLEIWGAEYQEADALLIRPEYRKLFDDLCEREHVPVAFVGRITGDGRIVLHDELDESTPVNLDLNHVLGDMPQKTFALTRLPPCLEPLALPDGLTVADALDRVLRLVSVGSKRFLTTKVDRSVTGLVGRQQCAGPLQLTVADVAVIAQSHFGVTGAAAPVSALGDVKCSGNWMWAAKLPGEGAALYDAAVALHDILVELGVAIDGGKDSLSMAARAPDGVGGEETVKAPGSLVISAYVTCPDITKTVTPNLQQPGRGRLLYVDLGQGRYRLGGSALAQVFGQVGDQVPDVDDPGLLRRAFEVVQLLLDRGLVLAGHDRSDGGLLTTVLEMAFAGNCGVDIDVPAVGVDPMHALFAEELGLVLEIGDDDLRSVLQVFDDADVPCVVVGASRSDERVQVVVNGEAVLDADVRDLRDVWEATSFELDRLQANPACVDEERQALRDRRTPPYETPYRPALTSAAVLQSTNKPRVAIIREEGSNGDREMTSAFQAAGFEPWDVVMSDLRATRIELERFRGVVFVGGFSFADVMDSAKGWAGVIRFNEALRSQFDRFYERQDTFSLGVCNGCQLSALLGWLPWRGISGADQPRFIHNASGRFESRFSTVRILPSPAIMLAGMEGATLGVWAAHGEGRAHFPRPAILDRVESQRLAPVRFVDDDGAATERYPYNPNGSPRGVAGLCSPDGRHLAMMPHPERSVFNWQWGWMPPAWRDAFEVSPWLRMFQNAREWCESTR
jgi:phosphoribosylformylglycinamidine synthase